MAGRVTDAEALPVSQESISGNPEIAGDDEMSQISAPVRLADNCTVPPESDNVTGDALKELITGGGSAATVRVVFAFLVLDPVAARVNL